MGNHSFVGTDRGAMACIDIHPVVQSARDQRADILRRKEEGEAAEVLSGRIFDTIPKPHNSREYVFNFSNVWMVEGAHKGSVERILFCKREPALLLSLGTDARVCMW